MGIRIGNIELENRVLLAPMAGITDLTFRTICKEFGAALVCTEMISAKGLYYGDNKTQQLMKINNTNRPVSLQLFGSEPNIIEDVVKNKINYRNDIDIIDINMGCPAPKIVKNGDGSSLMNDPKLAGEIVKAVKNVSRKPITVKIRKGWNDENVNAVEIARIIEKNGADAVAVHGRTRMQFYSGKVDLDIIKKVKEKVSIPVIGSGDVFSPEDAKHMLEYTKCDGIMIARGALGNPWIISRTINYIEDNKIEQEPKPIEKIQMLKKHIKMLTEETNEKKAVLEMRKHAGWYIKGLRNSADIRNKINKINKIEELFFLLDDYIKSYNI